MYTRNKLASHVSNIQFSPDSPGAYFFIE